MEQFEPFSGVAEIDECGCFAASQELKRLVGYLPEETYTYGELTGLEHLRFAGDMHEIPGDRLRARIDGRLGRFDLKEAANQIVREYSLGMRRKLGLGIALLHQPRLLLLDEP